MRDSSSYGCDQFRLSASVARIKGDFVSVAVLCTVAVNGDHWNYEAEGKYIIITRYLTLIYHNLYVQLLILGWQHT